MEPQQPENLQNTFTASYQAPEAPASPEIGAPPKSKFSRFLSHKKPIIGTLLAVLIVGLAVGSYFMFFHKAEQKKVYHVGILSCYDYFKTIPDGFKQGLTDLGYIEGQDITYDVQMSASENEADIQPILQKFITDKADLIVVSPTQAAQTAKKIASQANIPVIFGSAFTEGNDLIESVSHPGGNITGVRWPASPEFDLSILSIFHEIAPSVKRLWIPYNKVDPLVKDQLEALRPAAASMGITLVEFPASSVEEVLADLNARDKLPDTGIDGMTTIAESLSSSVEILNAMASFADKHNIPVTIGKEDYAFFTLAPDAYKSGKQAASLADKIFKGAQAGTIPVVSVDNVFVINYKVTTKLGLTVPDSLLGRADRIIR
jgi:putative tryptophan/tyrosine transport system substrate-binding protein